ncbi:MAG: hypothetical protein AAB564_01445 [Patescibacteria group bacterium]
MASLKELKRFFEDSEYKISFNWIDKNTFGNINYSKEKIFINIYILLINTFIHEFLHNKYPKLSEKKIEEKTKNYSNHLTVSDIKKITKYLLKKMAWEKEKK